MRRIVLWSVFAFVVGVLGGGALFSESQSRSLIALHQCRDCLSKNELLGLIGSVVVLKVPGMLPDVLVETDYTVVFSHPSPNRPKHFVLVPKRDAKHVGDIGVGYEPYIADLFLTLSSVIADQGMTEYRVWSNGPGFQVVEYLHFHLAGE